MCLLLCKEECYSPMPLQLLRVGIWAMYEVPLSMSLLGFGMGTMLSNFHMYDIILLLIVLLVWCENTRLLVYSAVV